MARVRDILIHVVVEEAQRQRKCHRKSDEHSIPKGHVCLVIKNAADGSKKNYCRDCAEEILEQAIARLTAMRKQFDITV